MVYYLSFYLYALGLALLYNLNRNNFFLVAILCGAVVFSGFRYDAGNDFFTYLDMVMGDKEYGRLEYLSAWLIDISSIFGTSIVFFFITSFLYIAVISYALQKGVALGFTSILLMLFFAASWLTSFGYVRQYVAVSFFFLGFIFLMERRYISYVFFTVIACLFHKSAVISVVALLFYIGFSRKERSVFVYLLLLASAFLVEGLIVRLVSYVGLYSQYVDKSINRYGTGIFAVLLFAFFINFVVAKSFLIKDCRFWAYSNMFFFGILLYAIFLSFGEYVVRVSYFFVPFFYAASYCLVDKMKPVGKSLMIAFYIALSTFTYFYTLYLAGANPTRDFLTNYKFALFI